MLASANLPQNPLEAKVALRDVDWKKAREESLPLRKAVVKSLACQYLGLDDALTEEEETVLDTFVPGRFGRGAKGVVAYHKFSAKGFIEHFLKRCV